MRFDLRRKMAVAMLGGMLAALSLGAVTPVSADDSTVVSDTPVVAQEQPVVDNTRTEDMGSDREDHTLDPVVIPNVSQLPIPGAITALNPAER